MKATQTLPAGLIRGGRFDLTSKPIVLILMNVIGFGLLALSGALFHALITALRPDYTNSLTISGLGGAFSLLLALVAVTVIMLVVHEGIHGLFFWVFTRSRPRFAFKGWYAYAAAPGWYIPVPQYLVVGLAPAVLMTLIGALLIPILPVKLLFPLLLLVAFNISGAVGDLWVVFWLLLRPRGSYTLDFGDAVEVYVPATAEEA